LSVTSVDKNASDEKQKGLGNKPSPNYYQATVKELLHKSLVTRSNYCVKEESPYKPDRTFLALVATAFLVSF